MQNLHYSAIKLLISFIIAGSLMFAGTSLIRYFDPGFSVGFFDLLGEPSTTAWLLLAVIAGLTFAGLSALPAFPATGGEGSGGRDGPAGK